MADTANTLISSAVEKARRDVAGHFGITLEDDDPALVSAIIAERVTREVIALERQNNADNQLLSVGDVRTVLLDVRDQTIDVTNQIVGVVWMQIQEGLEERVKQLVDDVGEVERSRKSFAMFSAGTLCGLCVAMLGALLWRWFLKN